MGGAGLRPFPSRLPGPPPASPRRRQRWGIRARVAKCAHALWATFAYWELGSHASDAKISTAAMRAVPSSGGPVARRVANNLKGDLLAFDRLDTCTELSRGVENLIETLDQLTTSAYDGVSRLGKTLETAKQINPQRVAIPRMPLRVTPATSLQGRAPLCSIDCLSCLCQASGRCQVCRGRSTFSLMSSSVSLPVTACV